MTLTYNDAVERLLWLGHEGRNLKWDLANVRAVLEHLGRPQERFASLHIAGTNGKGSVAAMVAAILVAAGYRTGLYTSPHLMRMNERIVVDGSSISDVEFAASFQAVEGAVEALLAENLLPHHPSYFECLTAMAFHHFARAGVQIAVLEVGMGGRLDATNVVTPAVTVITPVDFDHERYLGNSIEQIAGEKAGIIKPGIPVVNSAGHAVAREVVARRAAALGAPLVGLEATLRAEEPTAEDFGRYRFTLCGTDGSRVPVWLGLRGSFQIGNALTAVAAVRQLVGAGWAIPEGAIRQGLEQVHWPGRMQLVRRQPLVFLDGAHNPAGARQVLRYWEEHLAGRPIHLVYGTVRDKAVGEVAELLFPRAARVVVTSPATERAASAGMLARVGREFNREVRVEPDAASALAQALAGAAPNDAVFVTGSLFLVGECLQALAAQEWEASARTGVPAGPTPAPGKTA